jgi:hypothetical protein
MRLPLPIRNFSPARLISRVSVLARIIIIAVIPVIGFLANGFGFMTAQSEVEDAFRSAHQAAEVMSRVAGASTDARATAANVKDLADALSTEAERLNTQVRQFLSDVQAA